MPTITMLDSDGSNPSTSGTAASRLAGELTRMTSAPGWGRETRAASARTWAWGPSVLETDMAVKPFWDRIRQLGCCGRAPGAPARGMRLVSG